MSEQETAKLGLPLVQPAQAQKHVTVNEGLMRLDGLVNLVLESADLATPPETVVDGVAYGVPASAVNAWAGQGGRIAIGANGGWVFADPAAGQRAMLRDRGLPAIHDGKAWRIGAITMGALGSGLSAGLAEAVVTLTAGERVTSLVYIPAGAMVIGASARVVEKITGSAKTWRLGTVDSDGGGSDRFGKGLGLDAGSYAGGMLSLPMTYWAPAPLVISAEGGAFTGGAISVSVHWLTVAIPA
ncbi:MAG: DUF2793 domain-containing protein [Paracoccus sp. (in: a-proteobacteria)]|uniref:DUF2793 domain-containing protein n=1 Tax=Paracoccus sp. TaxID=267 RepID=UPI0026DFFD34|nr:DUF2793 domain-containing protein [Paracoccus sp. (in: a-proteobacteria)]MDO5621547.1 DUF2793 domain-containing protein [Paracoccus sp. (in: a-proteobacteria)]